MRDITKSVISTCAGLIVLGIGMFVSGVFLSGNVGLRLDYKNKKAISDSKETVNEIKTLDSFTEMEINVPYSNVEIIEGDEYKLEYCIKQEGNLQADVSDGKLKLDYRHTEETSGFTLNVFYFDSSFDSEYFKLYIPSDASVKKADIKIESGDLDIDGVDIGEIKVKDEYGYVKLNEIQSDKIEIEADSGSIKGEKITANTVELKDSFGSINLDDLKTKTANMKVESGSIHIDNGEIDEADLESEFGSIELSLKGKETDYSYNLNTEFGSMKINGNKVGKEEGESDINKYSKEGGSKTIKAKTESGSIKIDFE